MIDSRQSRSQVLWSSHDAENATAGQATLPWQARGISIDTRRLEVGDLFVALQDRRDGHGFLTAAFKNGAAAAMVTHIPDDAPQDKPYLVVPDVLAGLEDLARFARARSRAKVIAVTGSAGKTTTKNMLSHILPLHVHAAEASFNNHWGVPLTLARLPAQADFAVVEIGTNHPGEIAPLAQMVRPHVAIVTTIAPAHIEGFSQYQHWSSALDLIALEKAQIFEGLEQEGAAIIGVDGVHGLALGAIANGKNAQTIYVGNAAPFDLAGTFPAYQRARCNENSIIRHAVEQKGPNNWQHGLYWQGRPMVLRLCQDAPHIVHNMVLALAAGRAVGADFDELCAKAASWRPGAGRGEVFYARLPRADQQTQITVLDESYNANPASMRAAIATLYAHKQKLPLMAILGDMAELGASTAQYHREIGVFIGQHDQEHHPLTLWTLGEFASLYASVLNPGQHRHFATLEDIKSAMLSINSDCALLLKASNSVGLSKVVSVLKSHKIEVNRTSKELGN